VSGNDYIMMALSSFTSGVLAEISLDDANGMLALDETLFVEHKSEVGDHESFKLVAAIAAFANTAAVGYWSARETAR
jgi:hypothetical protein